MVSATIDLKELSDALPRLEKALNGGIVKAVDSQAKLLLRNNNSASLLKLTPPRGIDEGRDIGHWAVARDANRVFASRGTINTILSRARKKAAFSRYIKNGELEKAKELLNGQTQASVEVKGYTTKSGKQVRGYRQTRGVSDLGDNRLGYIQQIAPTPDEGMLKQRRGTRYKVNRKQWSAVVLRGKSLEKLVDKLQKRVGSMKAGWRFAAKSLGVSLPPYVNAATSKINGSFKSKLLAFGYSVEMTNTTPRVDKLLTQSTVDFLVGLRLQNLTAFLEKTAAEAAAREK